MTAPARPLARRWEIWGGAVSDGNGEPIEEAVSEHNVLVAAHEADRALVETLVNLLQRSQEELRLIRMKDTGALYDTTLRIEIDLALAAAGRAGR